MGVLSATRLYVAFDAEAVTVAAVGRGPGRTRLRGFRRVPLSPGALVPSPAGANLVRADEVRGGLDRALDELDRPAHRATLVLPDGVARLALMEPPPGAEPRDYVRFRLASSLPWPASEAAIDLLRVGRRRAIGAALRRATVGRFEQLAAGAGLSVDRVHLAPLMAVDALLARSRPDAVYAFLGDVALCLVLVREGELAVLRSRRRDGSGNEARWLVGEAGRVTQQAGDGRGPFDLVLSGSGAARLREALGMSPPVTPDLDGPVRWPDTVEPVWLAGALA